MTERAEQFEERDEDTGETALEEETPGTGGEPAATDNMQLPGVPSDPASVTAVESADSAAPAQTEAGARTALEPEDSAAAEEEPEQQQAG